MTQAAHLFKETTGTTRATFNYVRDNPYVSIADAIEALERLGYNPSSTTSLISQMVKQGLISRDKDRKLTALVKEYQPLKSAAAFRMGGSVKKAKQPKPPKQTPQQAKQPPQQPKQTLDLRASTRQAKPEGIAALDTQGIVRAQLSAPAATTLLTAKQVLETLSVKEARALYLELKEMFGG